MKALKKFLGLDQYESARRILAKYFQHDPQSDNYTYVGPALIARKQMVAVAEGKSLF